MSNFIRGDWMLSPKTAQDIVCSRHQQKWGCGDLRTVFIKWSSQGKVACNLPVTTHQFSIMFIIPPAVGLRRKLVDGGLDLTVHFKNMHIYIHTPPLCHCNVPFNSEVQTSVSCFSLSSSTPSHEEKQPTHQPPKKPKNEMCACRAGSEPWKRSYVNATVWGWLVCWCWF